MAEKNKIVQGTLSRVSDYARARSIQPGMFSTLDKLINNAPFPQAPADQWESYLQPGRMFQDGGVQVPLKKEELQYSGLEVILAEAAELGVPIDRTTLSNAVLERRPEFSLLRGRPGYPAGADEIDLANVVSMDPTLQGYGNRLSVDQDRYGPSSGMSGLYHSSPSARYEESVTRYPMRRGRSHFGNDVLSWSRSTRHQNTSHGNVRLVEEIQSDVHQRARKKRWLDTAGSPGELLYIDDGGHYDASFFAERLPENARREVHELAEKYTNEVSHDDGSIPYSNHMARERAYEERLREIVAPHRELLEDVGYITDAELDRYDQYVVSDELDAEELEFVDELHDRMGMFEPPSDAPFKDPSEYASLELKKQLLDAVDVGDDWLALTTSNEQIARYGGQGADPKREAGMRHVYDRVYRGELKKLANRYGGKIEDIELELRGGEDTRFRFMDNMETETPEDFGRALFTALNGSSRSAEIVLGIRPFLTMREVGESIMAYIGEDLNEIMRPDGRRSFAQEASSVVDSMVEAIGPDFAVRDVLNSGGEPYDILVEFVEELVEEIKLAIEVRGASLPSSSHITVPAMRITPEMGERILSTGVPLFARGGLVRLKKIYEELADG